MNTPLSKEKQKTTRDISPEEKVNSNVTQAILDIDYQFSKAKVGIPSDEAVLEAKDWVDNGSKL